MAGMTTGNTGVLIRSQIWSDQLKDVLKDELAAMKYVNWISFNDGTTMNIPSIGDLDAYDYSEDTAIEYTPMDVGNFQFSITEYKASGTYITTKARQDLHYAAQLEAAFLPAQSRAIMVQMETFLLKQGQPGTSGGQTVAATNQINGADHRWVASDTVNSVRTLGLKDFAKARYVLKKANVPDTNLIAMVDPSFEYTFNTQTNFVNVSNNKAYEGIVRDGIATGMRFLANIYGFDVYMSNYLPLCGTNQTGTAETISTVASAANSVVSLFFSADASVKPWIGAIKQQPKVDGEYNKDFQREEYVTTARYGAKLYRPENLVSVLSSPNVIV